MSRIFADVLQLYLKSSRQYRCSEICEIHECQIGVVCYLDSSTTGPEFHQSHADQGIAGMTSVNVLLTRLMKSSIPNPYALCEPLDGWDLYAVDA